MILLEFELISFPVKLEFVNTKEEHMKFRVIGNYDWDYNDKLFYKIKLLSF